MNLALFPDDPRLVNIHTPGEVAYIAHLFNCSCSKVLEAVRFIGSDRAKIFEWLVEDAAI